MAAAGQARPLGAAACVQDLAASVEAQLRLTRRALALCHSGGAGGGPAAAPAAAAVAAFAHAVEELKARAHPAALERELPEAPQRSKSDLSAGAVRNRDKPALSEEAAGGACEVLQPSEGGFAALTIGCSEESGAIPDRDKPARGEEALQPSESCPASQTGKCHEESGATADQHTLARRDEDVQGAAMPAPAEPGVPMPGVQLCSMWEALCHSSSPLVSAPSYEHMHTMKVISGSTDRFGETMHDGSCMSRHCMMSPSSRRLSIWHLLSLVVLSWDLVTLPLIAFRFDELPLNSVMTLITNVFWTLDLPFSFFVGYLDNGKLVMDMRIVAKRRARMVLPDLFIVVSDWCIYLLGMGDFFGLMRLGKTLRLSRALRFIRLARIIKIANRLEELTDMIISETLWACLNILKLLVCVMLFCHFGACLWFTLGSLEGLEDQTSGWVSSWLAAQKHREVNFVHAYLVSFHWVFAQFTPAPPPSHTSPTNIVEEAGVVGLLLAGWVQFMFLMGSVNAHMQMAKKDASKRLAEQKLWRKFATEHKLPAYLFNRIMNFVTSRHRRRQNVAESDIHSLRELPGSLLRELRLAVFTDVLVDHPLFQQLIQAHPSFMMDLCYTALRMRWLTKGDELFANRTPATKMYFVRGSGKPPQAALQFKAWSDHESGANLDDDSVRRPSLQRAITLITEGTWFCEMTLWLGRLVDGDVDSPLLHTGRATVLHSCSVAELDAPQFRSIAKCHPNVLGCLSEYAALFKESSQHFGLLPELWGARDESLRNVTQIFHVAELGASRWRTSTTTLGRVLRSAFSLQSR